MIKSIVRAVMALNSNARREHVAAGFAFGLLFALMPAGNLLWFALYFLTLFLKVNYGTQLLATLLLGLARPLLGAPLDALGWAILHAPPLQGFFTALYNAPIAPLTRFYNTIVMGGLAAGLALWLPVFFGMRAFVSLYRAKIAPRIMRSKIYKAFVKLPLVGKLLGAAQAASGISRVLG